LASISVGRTSKLQPSRGGEGKGAMASEQKKECRELGGEITIGAGIQE
jgi:hypothetical protein